MKKVMMLALCLLLAGFLAVDGAFAMPDVPAVFQNLAKRLGDALGIPEFGKGQLDVKIVSDDAPQQLYPGGRATRTAAVQNQGSQDAYFRFAIAVQYDAETWDKLAIAFDADAYAASDWTQIKIGDAPYRMKVFTYPEALKARVTSPDIKITIAMDRDVTSQQLMHYRSDFLQMKVLAIETTVFANESISNAKDALNLALPLEGFNPF